MPSVSGMHCLIVRLKFTNYLASHIPEDAEIHSNCHEDLKPHTILHLVEIRCSKFLENTVDIYFLDVWNVQYKLFL
jgi:hypothetical protein